MTENETPELSAAERSALDEWAPPGPAQDFEDRVVAALREERAPSASSNPRRRRIAMALGVAAALAGIALVATRSVGVASVGHAVAPSRVTRSIGGRAVAVLEPSADLAWRVRANGTTRIRQRSGSVFYRVEPGAPFVVATPAGVVTVLGTCFRVEVTPMEIRSGLVGAAAGAVLASAAWITVYEGSLSLANEHGEVRVGAGERARAAADAPPGKVGLGEGLAGLLDRPPPAEASREDLLVREAALRREVARLSRKGSEEADPESFERMGARFFDPPPDELRAMAARCELRSDMPDIEADSHEVDEDDARAIALTDAERRRIGLVTSDFRERFLSSLRALYVEATGDTAGATALSWNALGAEIHDKGAPGEWPGIRQRLVAEEAGLAEAPRDLSDVSPQEKWARLMDSAGDEYEEALASVLGADRARTLRARGGGWSSHYVTQGCPP
jgi:hypothetical protein